MKRQSVWDDPKTGLFAPSKPKIRYQFCEYWLKPTQLLAADETQFTILVQNRFALDWLSHRLADVIRRAIQRVTGRRVKLHFQLAAETTLPFSSATPSLQFAA